MSAPNASPAGALLAAAILETFGNSPDASPADYAGTQNLTDGPSQNVANEPPFSERIVHLRLADVQEYPREALDHYWSTVAP